MADDLDRVVSFIGNEELRAKLAASRERIGRSFDELLSGYAPEGGGPWSRHPEALTGS